jgi:16S rRNA (uracil1498-N3)-methyltransferase
MDYFYTPPDFIGPEELSISGNEFVHLTHVMRKTIGDSLRVVDGRGGAYDVVIADITKRYARCTIRRIHSQLHEPDVHVTLAVALLKNASRFDVLVEKTTEIGVVSIVPLVTERTIGRHAKVDRWQKLALAAMKQSGRSLLPTVHSPQQFTEFVSTTPMETDLRLLPDEQHQEPPIIEVLRRSAFASARLCIGPEGGFTEDEVTLARASGFVVVSLGPRRLRSETAAIIAVASILTGRL